MMYKETKKIFLAVGCLFVVCCYGQVTPLAVGLVADDLRTQITHCNGRFICSVTKGTTSFTLECINPDNVCDGTIDCKNGVDEHDCPRMCEEMVICPDKKKCALPCDGVSTCENGEDEQNCATKCAKPQLLCSDYVTCGTACDGMEQCPDRADEQNCPGACPAGKILCSDGKTCGKPCDRIAECPGEGDEMDCPFSCRCQKGEYICQASNKCLEREFVCEVSKFGNDLVPGSCFLGDFTGDDESNDGYGTRCIKG